MAHDLEGMVRHGGGGFAAEALAPTVLGDPVAELRFAWVLHFAANHTDEPVRLLRHDSGDQIAGPQHGNPPQEILGIERRIGKRDARRPPGNREIVQLTDDIARVRLAERAQRQPGGGDGRHRIDPKKKRRGGTHLSA